MKLLVNAPTGGQRIIEIDEGGEYFAPDLVLWDERTDGPLAEGITLGGMVREEGALVLDEALLAQAAASNTAAIRAAIAEEIKAFRDKRLIDGGFPLVLSGTTYWFHSDHVSRSQQQALARRADRIEAAAGDMNAPMPRDDNPAQPQVWKTRGGVWLPLTPAIVQALMVAASVQESGNFAACETHLAWLAAVPDPAAYDWSTGWPPVFVEGGA